MSMGDVTLELPGQVRIVVPDDLDVTTTYVLQEQGDWFEDEMRFVRALARPGMRVIDAGANFGVYALTFAGAVGPTGRVWAVEPGAQALAYLARSVAANDYTNLEILPCALFARRRPRISRQRRQPGNAPLERREGRRCDRNSHPRQPRPHRHRFRQDRRRRRGSQCAGRRHAVSRARNAADDDRVPR